MIDYLSDIDTRLFLFLNGINSPFWDNIMYFMSGKLSWLPLYLYIFILFYKQYAKKLWAVLLFSVILILLSDQISVHAFKEVFQRLRPCHNPGIKSMVHLVHNRCGGSYGFVSSHAANTFALAAFVGFIIKKKNFIYLMYSWALLVSYSRIYLGKHYPGDVIGGAVLGIAIGISTFLMFDYFMNKVVLKKGPS